MRLIDADWMLEHKYKELVSYDTYDLEEMLKCVPTVEQKHGHWIEEESTTLDNMNRFIVYRCSECGESTDAEDLPYCYRCGAKMDEVTK